MPFSEVSAHRATLEEAYLELTRDAVEYRAAGRGGGGAMSASVTTRARPSGRGPAGRAGFGPLLRAEWTKFRTVRGWVIGMIVAACWLIDLSACSPCSARHRLRATARTGAACLPAVSRSGRAARR